MVHVFDRNRRVRYKVILTKQSLPAGPLNNWAHASKSWVPTFVPAQAHKRIHDILAHQ